MHTCMHVYIHVLPYSSPPACPAVLLPLLVYRLRLDPAARRYIYIPVYMYIYMWCPKAHHFLPALQSYYLSWFTVYGSIQLLAASVQTAAFAAIGWFPNSDYELLWITLCLTGFSCIAFTFLIVSVLKGGANDPEKSKQATMAISFFSFVAVLGVFALCNFADAPAVGWALACLFAQVYTYTYIYIYIYIFISI